MQNMNHPALPWWRVRLVWLVLAGPALVVVAGFATAVIAVSGADADVRSSRVQPAQAQSPAQMPALQARNHAATR